MVSSKVIYSRWSQANTQVSINLNHKTFFLSMNPSATPLLHRFHSHCSFFPHFSSFSLFQNDTPAIPIPYKEQFLSDRRSCIERTRSIRIVLALRFIPDHYRRPFLDSLCYCIVIMMLYTNLPDSKRKKKPREGNETIKILMCKAYTFECLRKQLNNCNTFHMSVNGNTA